MPAVSAVVYISLLHLSMPAQMLMTACPGHQVQRILLDWRHSVSGTQSEKVSCTQLLACLKLLNGQRLLIRHSMTSN